MSAALNLSIADQIDAANAEDNVVKITMTPAKPASFATTSLIEIEDDILPPTGRAARASAYPLAELEVNQSFFVPANDVDQTKLLGRLTTAASNRGKSLERKFIARKWTGKDGVLGVRVWRTA
jgi:hypothetical protein